MHEFKLVPNRAIVFFAFLHRTSPIFFFWSVFLILWQMTASRIRIAGRFKPCAHMGCFDLEAFIEINQRSRKVRIFLSDQFVQSLILLLNWTLLPHLQWQCPICLKNYSLDSIIIDPYFNRITSLVGLVEMKNMFSYMLCSEAHHYWFVAFICHLDPRLWKWHIWNWCQAWWFLES